MSDSTTAELRAIARDAGVQVWLHARQIANPAACVDLHGDEPVAIASLYKLPLAMVWADLVSQGDLDASEIMRLQSSERIPGPTGVAMLLDEVVVSMRDAVRLMLAVSDNACADAVTQKVGLDRLNTQLATLGLSGTTVRRGAGAALRQVMADTGAESPAEALKRLADIDHDVDTRQYDPAYSSTSTAHELCKVLARLWERETPAHRNVVESMAHQAWRHRLGSGFPHDDVAVFAKTGTLGRLRHESAIVQFPRERPIALTVLTRAARSEQHLPRVDAAIGELGRVAATPLRQPLGEG